MFKNSGLWLVIYSFNEENSLKRYSLACMLSQIGVLKVILLVAYSLELELQEFLLWNIAWFTIRIVSQAENYISHWKCKAELFVSCLLLQLYAFLFLISVMLKTEKGKAVFLRVKDIACYLKEVIFTKY